MDNSENPTLSTGSLCREDVIASVVAYVERCRGESVGKGKSRFPNLAGFCRYLGVGVEKLEELFGDDPEGYGVLCAVFEDEALNSELSPTLINSYLKRRLGYGERTETEKASLELPEVKLIFDHDIFEDGG